MQWLVEVRDLAGNIKWVSITAPDEATARTIGTQNGWIADSNVWHKDAIPADIKATVQPVAGFDVDINDFPTFGSLGIGQVGGGGTPVPFGNISNEPGGVSEAFDFGPGFEAGLRRQGINIGGGGGVRGAVARGQFDPLAARFFAQEAFRPGGDPAGVGADTSFQKFLADQGAAGTLFGGAGSLASRDLLDRAREFRDFTQTGLPSALAGTVLNPATTTEGMRLANIARDAGRQRFGSLARFLPSAGNLSQSFLSRDEPTRGTLADYLNQRIFG